MNEKNNQPLKVIFFKTILLILLIPMTLKAQEENEFFSATYSSVAKSKTENGNKIGLNILDVSLITPTIKIGKKTQLNNIISYKSLAYNSESSEVDSPGKLNDIQFALLIRQNLNERWNLMVVPQLIARSNFENKFGSRDFFPALAIIAMNKSKNHEGLEWGYGASYSRDFTKNTLTPLFAIKYSSLKYRIDVMLPIRAQFVMTPSQSWEYGVDASFETGIYNTSSKNNINTQYTRTINIPVGLTAAARISGMFWVKAKVGTQFLREYDFLDRSFKILPNQENKINASPYVSVGISLRLKE